MFRHGNLADKDDCSSQHRRLELALTGDYTNYSENRFAPPVVGVMAIFRQLRMALTWWKLISD